MDRKKQKRLEAAGWRVGSTQEFLGLSDAEAAFIEIKLALSAKLRSSRIERGMSQSQLAEALGSSQSRIAKMEATDPSVSLDLLVRGLLAAGATASEIASSISGGNSQRRTNVARRERKAG